jgi:hypothetical protein
MRCERTGTRRPGIVLAVALVCGAAAPAVAGQEPPRACVSPAAADDDVRLEWAPGRQLTWADFRGPTPGGTAAGSGSCVGFEVSWECESVTLVFDVRAVFDPTQSWVRAGSADDALLNHERRHFDLTELFARRLRKQFTGLTDPCKDPPSARRVVDGVVIDMYGDWGAAQKQYDADTGGGTEGVRQKAWDLKIEKALDGLREFEPER